MVATNRTDIMLSLDVLVYVTSLIQRDVKEMFQNLPRLRQYQTWQPLHHVQI